MIRTENDLVKPLKRLFYKRYVDDIYSRHKKNCTDQLYHELNNYHPNINLSIEVNPNKFLDTQVVTKNRKIETDVYRKSIPKRYKGNAINTDLHRLKQLSANFDKEVYRIKKKFLAADYPQKCVESVIRNLKMIK